MAQLALLGQNEDEDIFFVAYAYTFATFAFSNDEFFVKISC